MATAQEILTPIAEALDVEHNELLHGTHKSWKLDIAAHRYLDNLTGEEQLADVLNVMLYGLAQELNSHMLRVAPMYDNTPFYKERRAIFDSVTKQLDENQGI